MTPEHPEIGRELKVSELRPRTIVWLRKNDRLATLWVMEVTEQGVHFRAGAIGVEFLALRTGPGGEQITDDSHTLMTIYEYLGKP
jgi:hypothetical protein